MAARLGDEIGHGDTPTGAITAGSTDTLTEGLPQARLGDAATCEVPGHGDVSISSGSVSVLVDGLPAARIGDSVSCGATIITGAIAVFIGD